MIINGKCDKCFTDCPITVSGECPVCHETGYVGGIPGAVPVGPLTYPVIPDTSVADAWDLAAGAWDGVAQAADYAIENQPDDAWIFRVNRAEAWAHAAECHARAVAARGKA